MSSIWREFWFVLWVLAEGVMLQERITTTPGASPMHAKLREAMVSGVQCGMPRLGSDDPMDLTVANFAGRSLIGNRAANFTLSPTIVGGSDAIFGSICWQVINHQTLKLIV